MRQWLKASVFLWMTAACGDGSGAGIEDVPEEVQRLQEGLETEGYTILSTRQNGVGEGSFIPDARNPRHEKLIRSTAASEGLTDQEIELLITRMKATAEKNDSSQDEPPSG